MLILILVSVGGVWATIKIIEDKYPDEFKEFSNDVRAIVKRKHVRTRASRKMRKPLAKVKSHQKHIKK